MMIFKFYTHQNPRLNLQIGGTLRFCLNLFTLIILSITLSRLPLGIFIYIDNNIHIVSLNTLGSTSDIARIKGQMFVNMEMNFKHLSPIPTNDLSMFLLSDQSDKLNLRSKS